MKKTIAFLALAAAVTFVASVGMASATLPETTTLYAGQNISVGTVTVSNVSNNITIEYNTTGGWVLNETHLHVGYSVDDIPQTKKNNPIPGKFDYSAEHVPPVTVYTYTTIPVPDSGTTLYIAAQAEVALINETGYVVQEESAWAGIDVGVIAFEGKNWATYFTVTVDENL